MGSAVAVRLAEAGHPVTVWNRSPAAVGCSAGAGAATAGTPREAVSGAEVVLTFLADGDALLQVLRGPDGALAGLAPRTVLLDMGTSGPAAVAVAAELVAAAGGWFVDAPVSGSVAAAQSGTLMVMAGGPAAALDRARPVLAPLSRTVHHVGAVGSGATLKLTVNAIVFGLTEAVAEALVLAELAGIDRAAAYDVFCDSAAAAPAVTYRRDAFVHPEDATVSFRLALAAKDLRLARALAGRVGAPLPQLSATLAVVDAAVAAGYADADLAALAGHLRDVAAGAGAAPGTGEL